MTHLRLGDRGEVLGRGPADRLQRHRSTSPTGEDDVFAVDVETGKILWQYEATSTRRSSTVCCGWLSRGVALGDGMVFIGQLDGNMVALDQETGEVDVEDARSSTGRRARRSPPRRSTTTARSSPASSGGEFGVRGRLDGLRRQDRRGGLALLHRSPARARPAHETWPGDSDAWKHGGAPVWQTPVGRPRARADLLLDRQRHAGLDGSERAGRQPVSASIVALDVEDRQVQVALPDGPPRHLGLRRAEPDRPLRRRDRRQDVPGIARGRQDRLALLAQPRDRQAALGIDGEAGAAERASRRPPRRSPIPRNPPFIPHTVDRRGVRGDQGAGREASANAEARSRRSIARRDVHAAGKARRSSSRAGRRSGGTNWPPSSYNPKTAHVLRLLAVDGASGYPVRSVDRVQGGRDAPRQRPRAIAGFGTDAGHAHGDRRRHRRDRLAEDVDGRPATPARSRPRATSCSSGATTGELEAYNADDGESSGASRPAPAPTTRRRSSSTTASSTSPSTPAATRSPRRRTATTSGCSPSTASSDRPRRRRRAAGSTPARDAAARSRTEGAGRRGDEAAVAATRRPARRSSPTTAPSATASPARRQRRPGPDDDPGGQGHRRP